jgi:FkbM family methyltransferase
MTQLVDAVGADRQLPWALARLTRLPWQVKRWIAEHQGVWRYYTALCRRAGWNGSLLGWHTPTNGPLAGVRLRAIHPNHLWVPVGVYEPSVGKVVTAALADLKRQADGAGDIEVWDVGGHRGLFSMLCARNGADHVIAFEPSATNVAAFREHLTANPALADRIEILHAAVADRDDEIEFLVNARDGAVCQINGSGVDGYDHGEAATVQAVRAIRLDTFRASRATGPALVKIDVEGAEALVVFGAGRLLATDRPVVVMEVHNAAAARAAIATLRAARYRVWRIDNGGLLAAVADDFAYGHVLARPE